MGNNESQLTKKNTDDLIIEEASFVEQPKIRNRHRSKEETKEVTPVATAEEVQELVMRTSVSNLIKTSNDASEEGTEKQSGKSPKSFKEPEYDKSKFTLHVLKKEDTLDSISLHYKVKLEDVKRQNKLWKKEDIYARKYLLIPKISEQQFQLAIEKEESIRLANEDTVKMFIERTGLEPDIALLYVKRAKYSLSDALQKYDLDIKRDVGKTVDLISSDSGNNLLDSGMKLASNDKSDVTIIIERSNSSDVEESIVYGHVPAKRVNNKLQRRMVREENDIFDL